MKTRDDKLIFEAYKPGNAPREAFIMSEEHWEQAKRDLSDDGNHPSLPEVLDIFKEKHADMLDAPEPVVVSVWQTQLHYGKIHKSESVVAGESLSDAFSKLGSQGDYPRKGYVIQKITHDREAVDHEYNRHAHASANAYPEGSGLE